MTKKRKSVKLSDEKREISEILETLKDLSVEDRREVHGIIFGLKMAKSAKSA